MINFSEKLTVPAYGLCFLGILGGFIPTIIIQILCIIDIVRIGDDSAGSDAN